MLDLAKKHYPYWVAAIPAIIVYVYSSMIPSLSDPLAVVGLTFGMIVAGFTATQRNMLLAMGSARVVKFMANTDYHHDVLSHFAQCLYTSLVLSVVSVIWIVANEIACLGSIFVSLWIYLMVLVFLLVARNERLVFVIVKKFIEERRTKIK